ncbi:MAG TPA: hypothetical protein VFF68_11880, partial [Anaerolineaceae bacterium]|nr:hypothetical protein [Anaerolineaceae bacterium]
MTHRKHALPALRHAAAGALVLSLSLAGLKTAQAAGIAAIDPQTDFPAGFVPAGLVYGPGQSLWATLSGAAATGQIPLPGSVSLHPLPDFNPWDVTLGPDQALWLTEKEGDRIRRLTPGGEWSDFPLGEGSHAPTA